MTVNALPAVNPGSNQAICGGDTITLYGNGSVGSNINSNPSLSFNGSSDYITISDPNNSSVAPSSIVNSTNEISNWSVSLHIKRAAKMEIKPLYNLKTITTEVGQLEWRIICLE